jgi:hypothetical protein
LDNYGVYDNIITGKTNETISDTTRFVKGYKKENRGYGIATKSVIPSPIAQSDLGPIVPVAAANASSLASSVTVLSFTLKSAFGLSKPITQNAPSKYALCG